jgi:hypothetical protein
MLLIRAGKEQTTRNESILGARGLDFWNCSLELLFLLIFICPLPCQPMVSACSTPFPFSTEGYFLLTYTERSTEYLDKSQHRKKPYEGAYQANSRNLLKLADFEQIHESMLEGEFSWVGNFFRGLATITKGSKRRYVVISYIGSSISSGHPPSSNNEARFSHTLRLGCVSSSKWWGVSSKLFARDGIRTWRVLSNPNMASLVFTLTTGS